MHEIQHIIGLCGDAPAHLDILDLIAYNISDLLMIIKLTFKK